MTMPHFLALWSNPLRAARSGQVDEMESWCVGLTLTGMQQSKGMQKDAKNWAKPDMFLKLFNGTNSSWNIATRLGMNRDEIVVQTGSDSWTS